MTTATTSPLDPGGRRDDGAGAGTRDERAFDDFREEHWAPLLLQTFAVAGDLTAARTALHEAMADGWQHRPSGGEEPGELAAEVRRTAFTRATRRARPRRFARTGRAGPEQRQTLAALHAVPYQERVCVVLACLSDLPVTAVAEVVGAAPAATETLLDDGLDRVASSLARPVEALPTRLRELEPLVRAAARPTGRELRSSGVRRRRVFLAAGSVAAVALTVLAGLFVRGDDRPAPGDLPPQLGPTVTRSLLLGADDLGPVGPVRRWREVSTSRNTTGTGLNVTCQRDRFADPQGLRAFVRRFAVSGDGASARGRTAVQTVELSRTERQAHGGYERALRWFSGCDEPQTQLVASYDVTGLGDEATVLRFRNQAARRSSFAVGLVRTGHITTWTAVADPDDDGVSADALSRVLTTSLREVCASSSAGRCVADPQVAQAPPPASGEQPGMLAVVDLPPVDDIRQPWVGTDAVAATTNPAATGCDRTDFVATGASPTRTRTFLIPGSATPARFGLSETYGRYPSAARAQAVLGQVRRAMAACPDKQLGSKITATAQSPKGADRPWTLWRLQTEVSDQERVTFWMGVTRVGPYLAQVGFVPGDGDQDVTEEVFTDLVERARDRLVGLAAAAATQSSGTQSSGTRTSGTPSASSSPAPGS